MTRRTPNPPLRQKLGRGVAFGIGIVGGLIAFAPLTALLPGSAQGVLQWVVFWGLSWLAILVHELGHAVVGKLLGMTILRFHVVPLEIRLRPWSFHLTRQVLGQDLGGGGRFRTRAGYLAVGPRVAIACRSLGQFRQRWDSYCAGVSRARFRSRNRGEPDRHFLDLCDRQPRPVRYERRRDDSRGVASRFSASGMTEGCDELHAHPRRETMPVLWQP